MYEMAGRKVLVVGLGATGASAAAWLLSNGADVRVTESGDSEELRTRAERLRGAGAEVELGGHSLERFDVDQAIISPGIPPSSTIVKALAEASIEAISDVELAYRVSSCDVLAVTGTNGKTTTTTLLGEMLQAAGVPSVAAGNIGLPVLEALDRLPADGTLVLEVSSFQLAMTTTFLPRIACVLNIAVDHLDWHGSADDYVSAKARITMNQTPDDALVIDPDDEVVANAVAGSSARLVPFSTERDHPDGIGVRDETIVWQGTDLMPVADVALPGSAGLADSLAAAAVALAYGVEPEPVVETIRSFNALRHRMEVVATAGELTFIDDSKATNPHATLAAVTGMEDVVLIAGGRAKGVDLSPLRAIAGAVVAVVAIGEATEELEKVFEGVVPVDRAVSMDDAVELAAARSRGRGSVLLSPGCASLDMYRNYAERGDHFASAVRDLIAAGSRQSGPGEEGTVDRRAVDHES